MLHYECFFPSKDTLVYEIIGEYPAQSFFGVDRLTGQISVIQDLRLDGLKTTQYKVIHAC